MMVAEAVRPHHRTKLSELSERRIRMGDRGNGGEVSTSQYVQRQRLACGCAPEITGREMRNSYRYLRRRIRERASHIFHCRPFRGLSCDDHEIGAPCRAK